MYTSYTLEAILAVAFGRRIDIQKGESDEFSRSMELLLQGFADGELERLILFHSKFLVMISYCWELSMPAASTRSVSMGVYADEAHTFAF